MSEVTKIYNIKTIGFNEVMAELDALSKKFVEVKKAKQDASKAAADTAKTQGVESQAYKEAIALLEQTKIKELELKAAIKEKTNEAKAAQLVRQEELNKQKAALAGNTAEANSIAAIRKERALLNAAVISVAPGNPVQFQGNTLQYDEAIAKLKQLSATEQEFRRQFAKDSTLVGEYTSGIIQAFKQLGIDDLVTGQVTKASERLRGLNIEFDHLKRELETVRASGAGSFEDIERQLIENRREAGLLTQQIGHLQSELRGTGDIGNQITTGLKNGFKELKGQVGQFILSYVGIQAVLQGITSTFDKTIQIDSLDTALKNVSGSARELGINEDFLAKTTARLGLEALTTEQAFKNFYAASTQAGIGADSTRDIFTAAASASAALRLSQEDTNGVLLAFGQIASKGKVQAEELRGQIGERIPGAFAIAARAIGVTQQELNKMLQNGTVLSNEFLPKFAKELQKTFGGDTTKNVEGLQASINRLKNEFTEQLRSSNGAIGAVISAVVGALSLLLHILPAVTIALAAYAAIWGVANASMIAARVAAIASNIAFTAQYAVLTIATSISRAYAVAMNLVTLSMGRAAAASGLLRAAIAILSGPIGIVIGIVSLLAISVAAFGNAASKAVNSLTDMQRATKATKEVSNEAASAIAKEQGELDKLFKVATDASAASTSMLAAKQKLLDQYPDYFKATSAEKLTNEQLTAGYKALTASIKERAFAQAAAKIAAEAQAKVDEVAAIELKLDTEITSGTLKRGVFGGDRIRELANLSETELKVIEEATKGVVKITDGTAVFFEKDTQRVKRALQNLREDREKTTAAFDKINQKYNNPDNKKILPTGRTVDAIQADLKDANEKFEKAVIGSKDYIELRTKIINLKKELADADAVDPKAKKGTSGITKAVKDRLSIIESELREELTQQETHIINLQRTDEKGVIQNRITRKLTNDEEIENVNVVRAINIKYLDEKINYLNSRKKLDAAEKLQLATFVKEKADIELQSITKIQEIHNQEFQEMQTVLKNTLDSEIQAVKDADTKIQNSIDATPSQKAQSKLNSDKAILVLYEKYNQDVDILEKNLLQQTTRNSKEIIKEESKLKAAIATSEQDLSISMLDDIDARFDEDIAQIRIKFAQLREEILKSAKSQADKDNAISVLNNTETITIQSKEVVRNTQKRNLAEELFKAGKISSDQFEKIYAALNVAQNSLNETIDKTKLKFNDLQSFLTSKLAGAFKFDVSTEDGKAKAQLLQQTLVDAYSTAKSAMDGFYDAEAAQIERSRANNEKALTLEFEQKKAHAQSQAEQESLDKQFQQRKEANDREAFEKNKKIQVAQARINLGIQLSNLAVIAFAPNPLNIATLGAAGAIMYAIQAALALATYALNVSRINSAQFEQGGQVPKRGGKFGGKKHSHGGTKFTFQDEQYEAEVDELAIIRTKSAPARNKVFQIVGTHQQIASQLNVIGGGVSFAPGAKLKRFETGGLLGSSLTAPVFISSSTNSNTNNLDNKELLAVIKEQNTKLDRFANETSKRFERIEVIQVSSTVRKALQKEVQQKAIGTL